MILTLPVASRERVQSRLIEANNTRGTWPKQIAICARDHAKLKFEMRRYGFWNKPLNVMNVPIVEDDSVDERTVRFDWSE
jgi:hypothetical protein